MTGSTDKSTANGQVSLQMYSSLEDTAAMYGYEPQVDYGYGDTNNIEAPAKTTNEKRAPRSRRRNSTIVRRDPHNPLAVAEYLMGGPPRMSDRDLEVERENVEQVAA